MNNISNFYNVQDYFPIITATLIIDMIVIILSLTNVIKSKVLKKWYRSFDLGAVIADVFIIVIGIIATRFIYYKIFKEYSLLKFIGVAISIQFIHDLLFAYLFNSIPNTHSGIMNVFKEYGAELGAPILVADALMVIGSILLSNYLVNIPLNNTIIIFIVSVYILPYLIYSI